MNQLKVNSRSITLFIISVILLLTACTIRPKGVLSDSDMTDVLIDLHRLDGTLMTKGIIYSETEKRNGYYLSVLKKHDITQAQFDSSVVWYSKNPKKFNQIYQKVIDGLTQLQKDIENGEYDKTDSTQLKYNKLLIWNKPVRYILTADSPRTHLDFQIPGQSFMLGDIYVLKFHLKISREDSCLKPVIRFQINYLNGRVQGVIQKAYNDGLTRRYTFRLPARHASKIKSVSGQLLGSSQFRGKQNAVVDSISLYQWYDPSKQDSLLKILQKEDPKNYPTYNTEAETLPIKRNIRSLIFRK